MLHRIPYDIILCVLPSHAIRRQRIFLSVISQHSVFILIVIKIQKLYLFLSVYSFMAAVNVLEYLLIIGLCPLCKHNSPAQLLAVICACETAQLLYKGFTLFLCDELRRFHSVNKKFQLCNREQTRVYVIPILRTLYALYINTAFDKLLYIRYNSLTIRGYTLFLQPLDDLIDGQIMLRIRFRKQQSVYIDYP